MKTICLAEPSAPPPREKMTYLTFSAHIAAVLRLVPPADQAVEGWLRPELLLTTQQALAGFLLSMKTIGSKGGTCGTPLLYETDGNKQTIIGYLLRDRCFHLD